MSALDSSPLLWCHFEILLDTLRASVRLLKAAQLCQALHTPAVAYRRRVYADGVPASYVVLVLLRTGGGPVAGTAKSLIPTNEDWSVTQSGQAEQLQQALVRLRVIPRQNPVDRAVELPVVVVLAFLDK